MIAIATQESPPSSRGRTLLCAGFFLVVVALSGWRTANKLHPIGLPSETKIGMEDFRDAVYFPVVSLLSGENPYDTAAFMQKYPAKSPFPLYAPTTLLTHLPFGWLPIRASEAVYFAVSLLLVVVLAAVSLRIGEIPTSVANMLGLGGLILLSRPGHQNLMLGQLTLPIALFSIIALQLSGRRPVIAGLCAAMAVGKATFGLPVLSLMFLRKDFKAVAWGCAVAFVLNMSVLVIIAVNNGGFTRLYESMIQNGAEFQNQNPAGSPVLSFCRIDLLATCGRILGTAGPGWIGPMVMLAVLALAGRMWLRDSRNERNLVGATSAGLPGIAVLLCVYHQPHELLLLMPYMVCLWSQLKTADRQPVDVLVFILLTAVFANYAASATVLDRIGGTTGMLWLPITSINGVILLSVFIILCLRTRRVDKTTGNFLSS